MIYQDQERKKITDNQGNIKSSKKSNLAIHLTGQEKTVKKNFQ